MPRSLANVFLIGLACLLSTACGGGAESGAPVAQSHAPASLLAERVAVVAPAAVAGGAQASAGPSSSRADPTQARFNGPQGLASGPDGALFVADTRNYTIRKITKHGNVTTIAGLAGVPGSADGSGSNARFTEPRAIAVDAAGTAYVADGSAIRKISADGMVTTIAGIQGAFGEADGIGAAARFRAPTGIAVDSKGNVFVVDPFDFQRRLRKIAPDGAVSTFAGGFEGATRIPQDGAGAMAAFIGPTGLAIDRHDHLYVTDIGLGGITVGNLFDGTAFVRRVTPGAVVKTIAGNVGFTSLPAGGPLALLSRSHGVVVKSCGTIYATDHFDAGNRVMSVASNGTVSALPLDQSKFGALSHLANGRDDILYASDRGGHTILKIQGGTVSVLAGATGVPGSVDVP
ncbi:MAG TPA: hypothetical protein VEC06_18690 [Paucimonas sp.]|nr:hypothetical protein [Paucimonas sp.]